MNPANENLNIPKISPAASSSGVSSEDPASGENTPREQRDKKQKLKAEKSSDEEKATTDKADGENSENGGASTEKPASPKAAEKSGTDGDAAAEELKGAAAAEELEGAVGALNIEGASAEEDSAAAASAEGDTDLYNNLIEERAKQFDEKPVYMTIDQFFAQLNAPGKTDELKIRELKQQISQRQLYTRVIPNLANDVCHFWGDPCTKCIILQCHMDHTAKVADEILKLKKVLEKLQKGAEVLESDIAHHSSDDEPASCSPLKLLRMKCLAKQDSQ